MRVPTEDVSRRLARVPSRVGLETLRSVNHRAAWVRGVRRERGLIEVAKANRRLGHGLPLVCLSRLDATQSPVPLASRVAATDHPWRPSIGSV